HAAPAQDLQDLVAGHGRPGRLTAGRPRRGSWASHERYRPTAGRPALLELLQEGRLGVADTGGREGRGGELVEQGLAVAAEADVLQQGLLPLAVESFVEESFQFFQRGTGAHVESSAGGASRRAISSWIICWARRLATNTSPTPLGMRAAAPAPASPSRAGRRNASQVCGATRIRTRAHASSSSSRSNSSSSRASRSSRAATLSSTSPTALSPEPRPGSRLACWKSLMAWCVSVLSHPRKLRDGS